jgi:beta-lactamase class C
MILGPTPPPCLELAPWSRANAHERSTETGRFRIVTSVTASVATALVLPFVGSRTRRNFEVEPRICRVGASGRAPDVIDCDARRSNAPDDSARSEPVKMSFESCRIVRIGIRIAASFVASLFVLHAASSANASERGDIRAIVTRSVEPLMKRYALPGLAVGVSVDGRDYVFDYGVASLSTGEPVRDSTLFEIGSITKTFTATLASYAGVTQKLSLGDETSADYAPLRGSSFDHIRLLDLGTHTSGGLPLQFPDDLTTDDDAMRFYRQWKPTHEAGTYRLYSNTGIALLGVVAANRLGSDFSELMERLVFEPLGMTHTFLKVRASHDARYAQGYTSEGVPKRMAPGPLAPEAYGIRTTARDVLRFVDANMDLVPLGASLRRAIDETHTPYDQLGNMTQDLVWEQYRYPVTLRALLQGNSPEVLFDDEKVRPVDARSEPNPDVVINKTGSTNGFAAYVVFAPKRKIGVVLLANKSYPIHARVETAYRILTNLE